MSSTLKRIFRSSYNNNVGGNDQDVSESSAVSSPGGRLHVLNNQSPLSLYNNESISSHLSFTNDNEEEEDINNSINSNFQKDYRLQSSRGGATSSISPRRGRRRRQEGRHDPLMISPNNKKKKNSSSSTASMISSLLSCKRQTQCLLLGYFIIISTQVYIHRRNIQAWEEYWIQSALSLSLSSSSINSNNTARKKQLDSFLSQHLQSFKSLAANGENNGDYYHESGLGTGDATDTHVANLLLQDWDWEKAAVVHVAADSGSDGQAQHLTEGSLLPTWMKEYFIWHQETLAQLDMHRDEWKQYHYFIVRCLIMDGDRCGDLSHRLQSLPIALYMSAAVNANAANNTTDTSASSSSPPPRRLLFIKWEQPAPLEKFLLPPIIFHNNHKIGIDWRLPKWLDDVLSPDYDTVHTIVGNSAYAMNEVNNKTKTVIMMRHLTRDHGSRMYNDLRQIQLLNTTNAQQQKQQQHVISKEPSFELVFRHVWHALFQPSPPVQELYEKNIQALQLINNNNNNTSNSIGYHHASSIQPFLLLHMPDLNEDTKPDIVKIIVSGAVNCVNNLLSQSNNSTNTIQQVVVTSQSINMIQSVMSIHHDNDPQQQHQYNMIALKTRQDLLDLDYTQDMTWYYNHTAEYYHQVFAYIHLWTHADCIVYGNEGDGDHWKFLLVRNPKCAAQFKRRKRNFCHLVSLQHLVPPLPKDKVNQLLGLTNDGSDDSGSGTAAAKPAAAVVDSTNNNNNNNNNMTKQGRYQPAQKAIAAIAAKATYNFVPSPEFPEWMNEYFAWHGEERSRLTQKNWKTYKYLVVRCLAVDDKCGGASDRLQSLPLAILFASLSGRFLLIHWERPCSLQEFFIPPKGGLDWRMPSWLHEKLDYKHAKVIVMTAFKPVMMNTPLVTMRHQKFWPEFYNTRKLEHEHSYEDMFHAIWQRVFEPTLPVQALIEKHMREMKLVKGKYVAVHIRAKYIHDLTKDTRAIHNALNCASTLRPGYPIYVASDSTQVIRMAMEYGKSKGATVAARTDEYEPLHLDRGAEFLNHKNRNAKWQDHSASQYYDVFIDLYLLGDSECLTHGYGGYGRLGSLLSYNQTCSINHMEEVCTWHGKEDAIAGGVIDIVQS